MICRIWYMSLRSMIILSCRYPIGNSVCSVRLKNMPAVYTLMRFDVILYWLIVPFSVTSHGCPYATEATLYDMGKVSHELTKNGWYDNKKQNKPNIYRDNLVFGILASRQIGYPLICLLFSDDFLCVAVHQGAFFPQRVYSEPSLRTSLFIFDRHAEEISKYELHGGHWNGGSKADRPQFRCPAGETGPDDAAGGCGPSWDDNTGVPVSDGRNPQSLGRHHCGGWGGTYRVHLFAHRERCV